jgi:hypothetical protein
MPRSGKPTYYQGEIPFGDAYGGLEEKTGATIWRVALCHFPDYPYRNIVWRENQLWSGWLTLQGEKRGRSAAYFEWLDDDGRQFPMFLTDLVALLKDPAVEIKAGRVLGTWIGVKRGSNYGIRYYAELPSEPKTESFPLAGSLPAPKVLFASKKAS